MLKFNDSNAFGGGVSSLSSLTGTEQGIQAAEGGKALSWRAFCRKLIEIKSPLPLCLESAPRSESFSYEPTVQHRSISSQFGFAVGLGSLSLTRRVCENPVSRLRRC